MINWTLIRLSKTERNILSDKLSRCHLQQASSVLRENVILTTLYGGACAHLIGKYGPPGGCLPPNLLLLPLPNGANFPTIHSGLGIMIHLLWQFWVKITGKSISQSQYWLVWKSLFGFFPNNDVIGIPLTYTLWPRGFDSEEKIVIFWFGGSVLQMWYSDT